MRRVTAAGRLEWRSMAGRSLLMASKVMLLVPFLMRLSIDVSTPESWESARSEVAGWLLSQLVNADLKCSTIVILSSFRYFGK